MRFEGEGFGQPAIRVLDGGSMIGSPLGISRFTLCC
jgi:hypothetical protein